MKLIREYGRIYFLIALLLSIVLVWYIVITETRDGMLTVAFLDVGQGDAIFIEAPNGVQVLIDGGANRGVLSALSHVMPFYDRTIDVVIATHPDLDHIGGLSSVFDTFSVAMFLDPGVRGDSAAYRALEERVIREEEVERYVARRGMEIVLDEKTTLDILFPDRDMNGANPNDASIIVRLTYGETIFIFTGDSPQKIEKFLVSLDGKSLKADVLKVGHHGSKTSSNERFVGFVSPSVAVISAGKDNRYGHPHQEVLDILSAFGINILTTFDKGTIVIKSDGEDIFY